jgi:hypothetical protein
MTIMLATLCQVAAFMGAIYFIDKKLHDKKEEIEQIENDPAVEEVSRKLTRDGELFRKITQWSEVPCWMKANLACGGLLLCAANYVLILYSDCFVNTFTVTSSIKCDLDGSVLNIIKPMGWVAIGLLFAGITNLVIYKRWAGAKVKAASKRMGSDSSVEPATEPEIAEETGVSVPVGRKQPAAQDPQQQPVQVPQLEGELTRPHSETIEA